MILGLELLFFFFPFGPGPICLAPLIALVRAKTVIACNSVLWYPVLKKLSLLTSERLSRSRVFGEFSWGEQCDFYLPFRSTKCYFVDRNSNKFLYLMWVHRLFEGTKQLSSNITKDLWQDHEYVVWTCNTREGRGKNKQTKNQHHSYVQPEPVGYIVENYENLTPEYL